MVFLESVFLTVPPIGLVLTVQVFLWCLICKCKCMCTKKSLSEMINERNSASILAASSSTNGLVTPKSRLSLDQLSNYGDNDDNEGPRAQGSIRSSLWMLMSLNFICLFHYIYNVITLCETFLHFIIGEKQKLEIESVHYLGINAFCILTRSSYLIIYFVFHREFRQSILRKFQNVVFKSSFHFITNPLNFCFLLIKDHVNYETSK